MYVVLLKFSGNKPKAPEFMDGHNAWIRDGFEAGVKLMLTLQNPISETVYDIERFSFGLMGAITIGWGLTLFYFSAPRTPAIWVIKCTDRPLSC